MICKGKKAHVVTIKDHASRAIMRKQISKISSDLADQLATPIEEGHLRDSLSRARNALFEAWTILATPFAELEGD